MIDRSVSIHLPYRGTFSDPRPHGLDSLPLPPEPMPSRDGLRPLKTWRYVAAFTPELMLCACLVRIGPVRQHFWAVWDRTTRALHEHSGPGCGGVQMARGRLSLRAGAISIDLDLAEAPGVETICPSGHSYAWTAKQGGIDAHGHVRLGTERREFLAARAIIDDTAAYYQRHTRWRWSAGVGRSTDGHAVAWNLVKGVNDPPQHSERTVWVDGLAHEPPPSRFAPDLSAVDGLTFTPEAVREEHQNLLIVRSSYRQPFGTFTGTLLPGLELREGLGVMEFHDVRW